MEQYIAALCRPTVVRGRGVGRGGREKEVGGEGASCFLTPPRDPNRVIVAFNIIHHHLFIAIVL